MKRKIEKELVSWKASKNRKPLILKGARQVGKTYSVLKFGNEEFRQVAHIDFSAQRDICDLFESDITPKNIIPQLEIRLKMKIEPHTTLLFFDEIQACDRALTSLKYFNEQAPEIPLIAAGSLLGISLNRSDYSFPTGKVELLTLHPMNFEEFLWAMNEESLATLICEHYETNDKFGLHEYAFDLYSKYLLYGGMPEVVKLLAEESAGFEELRNIQSALADAYVADMTKYASPLDSAKILNVWNGVPEQLAKANHKFQYSTISSSARAFQYEAPINWLHAAGLVTFCHRISEAISPLGAFTENDFFKLYLFDTGLLSGIYQASPEDITPSDSKNARFRGGLVENYVAQQLTANEIDCLYWGTQSKSEIDFVITDPDGNIIPLEIKSGKNVSSRSLESYRKSYDPEYIMRMSAKNFGFENGIKSIPLYAAFCIGK